MASTQALLYPRYKKRRACARGKLSPLSPVLQSPSRVPKSSLGTLSGGPGSASSPTSQREADSSTNGHGSRRQAPCSLVRPKTVNRRRCYLSNDVNDIMQAAFQDMVVAKPNDIVKFLVCYFAKMCNEDEGDCLNALQLKRQKKLLAAKRDEVKQEVTSKQAVLDALLLEVAKVKAVQQERARVIRDKEILQEQEEQQALMKKKRSQEEAQRGGNGSVVALPSPSSSSSPAAAAVGASSRGSTTTGSPPPSSLIPGSVTTPAEATSSTAMSGGSASSIKDDELFISTNEQMTSFMARGGKTRETSNRLEPEAPGSNNQYLVFMDVGVKERED